MSPAFLRRAAGAMLPLGVFAAVFLTRLAYVSFANDHFDRISKGRQILAFGAAPFRDFFDPGFFLTLYSSAAVQAVFGDTLLGEALLSITFISAGFALAFVMAREMSGSTWIALVATAAAAATFPRLYNYDKVLFFPLGVFLAWRYIQHPGLGRLVALACATGLAALYRYDSALYMALGASAAILAVHVSTPRLALTQMAVYAGGVLLTIAPAAGLVALTGNLPDAARQVAEYARREAVRSEILQPPRFDIDASAPLLVRGPSVAVRWRPGVSDDARSAAEARYTLDGGAFQDGRTWRYRLIDVSEANVEALVSDVRVEDTHGIERGPDRDRLLRSYAVLPGVVTLPNAAAWLAWMLLALPVLTCLIAAFGGAPRQWPMLAAAAAVCLSADLVLLRDPLEARIGDVAAPAVPLAAWLGVWLSRSDRRSVVWRGVQGVAGAAVLISAVALGPFLAPIVGEPASLSLDRLSASPASPSLMPSSRTLGIVEYLRTCTQPDDRILVAWFAPEVFVFSGRGFAGGMSVYFGGHWSGAADQRTVIARLERESAPVAVLSAPVYGVFQRDFPLLDAYVTSAFEVAARSSMGDPEGEYRILVRKGAVITGRVPPDDLPCLR